VGDDYYLADAEQQGGLVRVTLAGTEDDRAGWLMVDMEQGYIREADYNGTRLRLDHFDLRPQPDHLFALPFELGV